MIVSPSCCGGHLLTPRTAGRVSVASRMTCLLLRRSLRLGPGREGKEITSGRRDAQGLAFSAVIPGRTLVEGEGRVGSRASPQIQSTPLFGWRWPAGVPVPVPADTRFYALGAWICGVLHPRGNLRPARAIPALQLLQRRAQGQDDAKRRAQRCIEAVQQASILAARRGWLS